MKKVYNILVSNDDGYHSKGIFTLFNALKEAGHQVVMVAPERERSTMSHALTLHKPLRMVEIGDRQFALSGTPADCVQVGLRYDWGFKIDTVISGINRGANLGMDVHYSGTVSCAREAALSGTPALAVSLVLSHLLTPEEKTSIQSYQHYETAARVVVELLPHLAELHRYPKRLLNVNVPNLTYEELRGVRLATLGERNYPGDLIFREDPRGRPYLWIGGNYQGFNPREGSDNDFIAEKFATVTPVDLDPTDEAMIREMKQWSIER